MNIKEHKIIFKNFVQKYVETREDAFIIKVTHTGDVVRIITHLGNLLGLTHHQLCLAQLAALYHDLGRFIQYEKYKTFNDAVSLNHAEYSIMILDELGVLNSLPIDEQKNIKVAIYEHNKRALTNGLSTNEKHLAMLVRDADKLSNFSFLIKKYDQSTEFNSNGNYRTEFIDSILNRIPIENSNLKSIDDYCLYYLSWFNDLNYTVSVNYAIKKNYIKKVISLIIDTNVKQLFIKHFGQLGIHDYLHKECTF